MFDSFVNVGLYEVNYAESRGRMVSLCELYPEQISSLDAAAAYGIVIPLVGESAAVELELPLHCTGSVPRISVHWISLPTRGLPGTEDPPPTGVGIVAARPRSIPERGPVPCRPFLSFVALLDTLGSEDLSR